MSHAIAQKQFGLLSFRIAGLKAAAQRLFARQVRRQGPPDRASEAEDLRRYAQDFLGSDPRFAAELFAAADRHERLS
ncbi:hypothetical protein [Eleftheria terrae]|uniref:hypothetical protein n=1 Tax=Eleftheria terrae TaxID=1597781 RepID=UPI00263A3E17|nr:hypothetical protein [Eleftheria terrae]WKB55516.1 hypothetical protein N7L95_25915 [Eleftheria terrae]